eukprot:679671-Pyramimonas_sp.AAC.1
MSAVAAGRMSECIASPATGFSPADAVAVGSPSAGDMTSERMTEVFYADGATEFIQDAWSDSPCGRALAT